MKKLLIVESPAKIKTISKFLGKEFKIMSTMGHIMDLPPKRLGITIDKTIDVEYVPLENKEKVIAELCKAAQSADIVYLGPDPDREGEIIAWHASNEISKVMHKNSTIYRITFNEITKDAIIDALEHPSTIDLQKVSAQQARRILDRLVGYEVSPILWKKLAPGLSAGRVQSVALRLICDREQEIRNFKPEEYWTIDGLFTYNNNEFTAALTHIGKKKFEAKNEALTKKTVDLVRKESFIIDSIQDKIRNRNPSAPFMTSTLQQAAYNKLGFSVKKTMQIAQQLYEGIPLADPQTPQALITYMRTDSLRIADSAIAQVRSFIQKNFSKEYLPSNAIHYSKKGKGKAQDAHEAIRPIDTTLDPEHIKKYLTNDTAELYELIWQRFVASQMKPAQYAQRHVTLLGGQYTFKATGSTLIFDGFLRVYAEEDDSGEKILLPQDLEEKKSVSLQKIDPKQHFTQPPARYTEASLVKELEKEGIGRPSTYATILNTIREREYTKLDTKKRFVPTELGMAVTSMLIDNLPHIMDIKFTAHMEEDLDKIAHGDLEKNILLSEFYTQFKKDLEAFRGDEGKAKRAAVTTEITCPSCTQSKLAIRFGKSGEFLGCLNFPECTFTSNFIRDESSGAINLVEAEKPQLLEEKCPECQKPLRKLKGKFGEFTACSGYPECKYIQRKKASFPCPLCKGDVVQKAWRGGQFWGCDNYPKCKFAIFDHIVEESCPKCKLPFLIVKVSKDGTTVYTCSDKECGYSKSKE